MTPSHDQRVRDLFERAVDAAPANRERLLAASPGATTRIEVAALLSAHDQSAGFLEPPPSTPVASAMQPTRIGRYTLVRLIGAGGMGAVYEALQDQPRRTVAIKLLRAPLASPASIRRFEHESQVLALLRHPGIAQVYEAGASADATPFFAMEYIPGARTIVEYADAAALDTRARLELFARVCDAVQFAHQNAVIHRDLKPGNILVDASGHPRVIDFGVARIADADMTAASLETGLGQLVGTLRYMSPEQCAGDPRDIDTRSDLYTLGVVLYELLTGRMPYDIGTTSIAHVPRIIREEPPTRPSAVRTALRGDVETIVLKALSKDRSARYQSAGEFAADIRRFLDHEPILAAPPSAFTAFRLFARRHHTVVAAASGILLALTLGLAASLWQADRAGRAAAEARRQSYISDIAAAQAALASDDGTALRRFLDRADPAHRGWEWRYLDAVSDSSVASRTLDSPPVGLSLLDDARLLVLSADANLRILDPRDPARDIHWTTLRGSAPQLTVSFDRSLAAISGGDDVIELWSLDSQTLVRTLRVPPGPLHRLALSPDNRLLAAAADDGLITLCDLTNHTPPRALHAGPGRPSLVSFSPDSTRLAVFLWSGEISAWRVADAQLLARLAIPTLAGGVDFTPDNSELIVAGADGRMFRCDLARAQVRSVALAHASEIFDLRSNADRTVFITASADTTARVWDARTGELRQRLRGHHAPVHHADISDDAATAVTADTLGVVKLWDIAAADADARGIHGPSWSEHIHFSRDPRRICVAETGRVHIIDSNGSSQLPPLLIPKGLIACAGFNADGTLVAARGGGSAVTIFDAGTGTPRASVPEPIPFADAARGGLAWLGATNRLIDALPGAPLRIIRAPEGDVVNTLGEPAPWVSVAASSDASIIAACTSDGRVVIRQAPAFDIVADATLDSHLTRALAISPDSSMLAAGTPDGRVILMSTADARVRRTLHAHATRVESLAFSPDATRLASGGGWDHAVRLWDPRTGDEMLTIRSDAMWSIALAFSPDGSRLGVGPVATGVRFFSTKR